MRSASSKALDVRPGELAIQLHDTRAEEKKAMKYMIAWVLGVPGGLILLWFLFNHMH